MNRKKTGIRKGQGGFSLIELLVAMTIIVILSTLSITAYNGDNSKATELYAKMEQYSNAMTRLKLDVSCFPLVTGVLTQQALAVAANSSCSVDMKANWKGPYIKNAALAADGKNLSLSEFAEGATLEVNRGSNINGSGNTRQWYLIADGIPSSVADRFMETCNKGYVDSTKKQYKKGNCVLGAANAVTVPTDDTGVKTIWMIFDERP